MPLKRARVRLHRACMSRDHLAHIRMIWTHHVSPAFQAEENVVCNFKCMTTQSVYGCHLTLRSAVSDVGVYLPNRYFLRDHGITSRMDMFNGMFSLYMNGRFFRQKDVKKEFWTEDPTALTELLVTDVQWYEQCTLTRAPPPVERHVVPKGPAVVPIFDISDFLMTLPGLPPSVASSPATTLAPETPRVPLPSVSSSPRPMGPPPIQSSSPKPRAPSREQVQIEVDTITREVEEKRFKRTADQQ